MPPRPSPVALPKHDHPTLATVASRVISSKHGETLALYRPTQGHATRRRKPGFTLVCGVIDVDACPESATDSHAETDNGTASPGRPDLARSVVLVGLMGAGKSSIGRRLAQRLGVSFVDADTEIELAAGRTIPEIFEDLGEPAFRDGERRVIRRLLTDDPPHVLATGGGAFMAPDTRALIKERGHSVWLNADLDVLFERVSRRSNRPLLKTSDPKATLAALMEERSPVYAEADLSVRTARAPIEVTVDMVYQALCQYLAESPSDVDARTGTR